MSEDKIFPPPPPKNGRRGTRWWWNRRKWWWRRRSRRSTGSGYTSGPGISGPDDVPACRELGT